MSPLEFIHFQRKFSPKQSTHFFYWLKGYYFIFRAYVNFAKVEDLFHFKEKFDGYVFIDREGNESQCLVEYAPYQKIPNPLKRLKKPDGKINTIDEDTDFAAFKNDYGKDEHLTLDTPETFLEAIEKKEKGKEKETSLLQAIKEKKAEKQRLRQEKFDARKKRDEDRRKFKEEEKKKRKESQKAEIHAKNNAGKKAGGSDKKRAGEMSTSQDENSHPASAVEITNKRSKKFDHKAEEKTKGKKEEPKEVKPKEKKYTDEEFEKIKLERKEKREQRERERQEKKLVKNKERPERQIYRPGMGRFSSQSISTSKGETNETLAEKEYESKESTPDSNQGVDQAGTAAGKKYSRGKSWRNSKQQQQQQSGTSSSSSAAPKNEAESKVYLTREFRRTSNGQGQKSDKVKGVKKEAEAKQQPQQDPVELPKKSGKSYANKRKERQQKKEIKNRDSNVEQGAVLDLPSD